MLYRAIYQTKNNQTVTLDFEARHWYDALEKLMRENDDIDRINSLRVI